MAGLMDGLMMGSTALQNQQYGAMATGSNVLNINSPGYHRQDVEVGIATPAGSTNGNALVRSGSSSLESNLRNAQTSFAFAETRMATLVGISSQLGDLSDNGLSGVVDRLFQSFRSLEADPSNTANRQNLLSQASILANRIQASAQSLQQQRSDIDTQIVAEVTTINTNITQIATFNEIILNAQANQNAPLSFNAMDQRDAILTNVAQSVGVQLATDKFGSYQVLVGNGLSLSFSQNCEPLTPVYNTTTGLHDITLPNTTEGVITERLLSGNVGALLTLRDQDIPNQLSQLDQFSYDLVTAVNGIFSTGYGLDGVTGRNLFTQPSVVDNAAITMSIDISMTGPETVAAASSSTSGPSDGSIMSALIDMEQQKVANDNTTTITNALANLIGTLGNTTAAAKSIYQNASVNQSTAQTLVEQQIGVSVDDQMLLLQRYERAYQAAVRIIATIDLLMQTVIDL